LCNKCIKVNSVIDNERRFVLCRATDNGAAVWWTAHDRNMHYESDNMMAMTI
jgi:hypothetical protein